MSLMKNSTQGRYTTSTKRIARNTLMLYLRQLLIMMVGLYTVRVVLNALGAQDYGIYNVVAGVVTMFSFLSGSLATASQRYFSFALGQNDESQLKRYFSMSFTIYCLVALMVVAIAETAGLWLVENKLVIPGERRQAVFWIYQASVLSTVCTMMTAPFMAAIIAHEDMDIYAYVSVAEVGLKLGVVLLLPLFQADKLIAYGLLMAGSVFANTAVYRCVCARKYSECKFSFSLDRKLFCELLGYTGWNLFGASVGVFKNQLVNVILNQFFSPVVNAARGIACQVNAAVNSFSQGFSTAVRPQIIKSYAGGNREGMLDLVYRSCKATFFLMYVFTLPLSLEMPYVLGLWLGGVPENAVPFTRLALLDALIDSVSYPLMAAAQATGKIALYQSVVGGVLLLNAPASYLALRLGAPACGVFVVAIACTVAASVVRLLILRPLVGFSLASFARKVVVPVSIASAMALTVPALFARWMEQGFFRLCGTTMLSILCLGAGGFLVALTKDERQWILSFVKGRR